MHFGLVLPPNFMNFKLKFMHFWRGPLAKFHQFLMKTSIQPQYITTWTKHNTGAQCTPNVITCRVPGSIERVQLHIPQIFVWHTTFHIIEFAPCVFAKESQSFFAGRTPVSTKNIAPTLLSWSASLIDLGVDSEVGSGIDFSRVQLQPLLLYPAWAIKSRVKVGPPLGC